MLRTDVAAVVGEDEMFSERWEACDILGLGWRVVVSGLEGVIAGLAIFT